MNETTHKSSDSSAQEWMKQLEQICLDVAAAANCYLYDFDFSGTGQGRTLRVFIDSSAGANIDDCSKVSRGLNEALDTNDVIPGGAYNLEVSTPGIDRVLRRAWHFEKVVGKKIWVKTRSAFGELGVQEPSLKGTKQIEAILKEFKDDTLTLENKKEDLKIPLAAVEKAKVVFEMKKNLKP